MNPKLAAEIFVHWNDELAGEPFMEVNELAHNAAPEPGETRRVGVYRLVEVVNVSSEIKVESVKKRGKS